MLRQLILLQIYEEEILLVLHIYIPQQPGRKHLAATKTEKNAQENGPYKEEHPHTTHTPHEADSGRAPLHTLLFGGSPLH